MKPPPPIPLENGSVTPSTAAAVTAASTALPPWRSVSIAAWVAWRSTVAAAPPLPVAVAGPVAGCAAAAPEAAARVIVIASSGATARRVRVFMPSELPEMPALEAPACGPPAQTSPTT